MRAQADGILLLPRVCSFGFISLILEGTSSVKYLHDPTPWKVVDPPINLTVEPMLRSQFQVTTLNPMKQATKKSFTLPICLIVHKSNPKSIFFFYNSVHETVICMAIIMPKRRSSMNPVALSPSLQKLLYQPSISSEVLPTADLAGSRTP